MIIPGLAKPWCWIQPKGTDEILRRLLDAREFSVDERERENMCSVAHGEIVRLRDEVAHWKHMHECAQNANSFRQDVIDEQG